METLRRYLPLFLIGVLTASAAGVLLGHAAHHAQVANGGCSAGIVRHLPCAAAEAAATVDFHLGAYHLLTNAVAAAVVLVTAAAFLTYLARQRLRMNADHSTHLRLWPTPAQASRACHPWTVTQRLGHWLVHTQHAPVDTTV